MGGSVVQRNLEAAGFAIEDRHNALVETARPSLQAFDSVLVQNAWNVIPESVFISLLRLYPAPMRSRMIARRRLAAFNIKRARKVVFLSNSAAEASQWLDIREVVVSPIHGSIIRTEEPSAAVMQTKYDNVLVIPGTVTWYKRPDLALECLEVLQSTSMDKLALHFVGPEDRSGCSELLRKKAAEKPSSVEIYQLPHADMQYAIRQAYAVVIPSALETLSLSFLEAAVQAKRLIASPIPVHLELAATIGVEPTWLGVQSSPGEAFNKGFVSPSEVRAQWNRLGKTLNLTRLYGH